MKYKLFTLYISTMSILLKYNYDICQKINQKNISTYSALVYPLV